MVLPDLNHRREDVVPGLLLAHDIVREHAAVPANVLELLSHLTGVIAHPVAGVASDVQLAVRIGR